MNCTNELQLICPEHTSNSIVHFTCVNYTVEWLPDNGFPPNVLVLLGCNHVDRLISWPYVLDKRRSISLYVLAPLKNNNNGNWNNHMVQSKYQGDNSQRSLIIACEKWTNVHLPPCRSKDRQAKQQSSSSYSECCFLFHLCNMNTRKEQNKIILEIHAHFCCN